MIGISIRPSYEGQYYPHSDKEPKFPCVSVQDGSPGGWWICQAKDMSEAAHLAAVANAAFAASGRWDYVKAALQEMEVETCEALDVSIREQSAHLADFDPKTIPADGPDPFE